MSFQNHVFFVEDKDTYTTILIGIISKGLINFELKFFQIDSFLTLFKFLSSLVKL
jgi:hypothetical protein